MSIKEKILEDIKEAMKARQADRLRVLRSLKARLMEKEISERKGGTATITDEQAIEVLMKAAKQRKESIEQRSEEHTSELQSRGHLVCRLLLEKKKQATTCTID